MYKFCLFLLFSFICCVFSSLLSNNENLRQIRNRQISVEARCRSQLNLTDPASFPRLLEPELNSTTEYKTFVRCVADGMKLLNNNKIHWANLKVFLRNYIENLISRITQLEAVEFCEKSVVEGDDVTETFFQVVKCLRDEGLELLRNYEELETKLKKELNALTECSNQTYVDEAVFTKLSDPATLSTNETKRFFECLADRMDLLNDTKVNWKSLKTLAKIHNRKNALEPKNVEKCEKSVVEGDDVCENSYQMFKCLSEKQLKVFTDVEGLYLKNLRGLKSTDHCDKTFNYTGDIKNYYPFVVLANSSAVITNKYKCYLKCLAEGTKFLYEGKFDWKFAKFVSTLQELFDRIVMTDALDTCETKVVVGEDLCENSYQVYNCMVKQSTKLREIFKEEATLEWMGVFK